MLVNEKQAAELLNISRRTLSRWTKEKIIPSLKQGRIRRYSVDKLREWVESNTA